MLGTTNGDLLGGFGANSYRKGVLRNSLYAEFDGHDLWIGVIMCRI
jgi:hypothetical protein